MSADIHDQPPDNNLYYPQDNAPAVEQVECPAYKKSKYIVSSMLGLAAPNFAAVTLGPFALVIPSYAYKPSHSLEPPNHEPHSYVPPLCAQDPYLEPAYGGATRDVDPPLQWRTNHDQLGGGAFSNQGVQQAPSGMFQGGLLDTQPPNPAVSFVETLPYHSGYASTQPLICSAQPSSYPTFPSPYSAHSLGQPLPQQQVRQSQSSIVPRTARSELINKGPARDWCSTQLDAAIPTIDIQRQEWVLKLVNAINNTANIYDKRSNAFKKHWEAPYYSAADKEMVS
jgi:hypothetical protein